MEHGTLGKLDRGDRRLILACIAIAAVSLFVGVRYYFLAFPEASIEFKVTRESSTPVARAFLEKLKLDPGGYRHAAVFGFDDEQKTFLERELGVEESNRLLATTVRLWRWQHRWYRPLQKEEMGVEVTPSGGVVAFRHLLAEEAEGADLPVDEARAAAEAFLAGTMGRSIDSLSFVEDSTQKRPHRTDHSFTWKVRGSEVKDADYRIDVEVAGAAIAGYGEYLKVPDAWSRSYEKLRSKNQITGAIDSVLMFLTWLAMVVFLVLRIRRGDVRWGPATILGGTMFALTAVSLLNSLPQALYAYDTTTSFGGFLIGRVLLALAGALFGGVAFFLLSASAEPFYRERFPKKLSLTSLLRFRALGTREFFLSSLVGITLTCFFFAYENVFYLIAHALGAWSPREVAYSDLLSTAFPWVYVLFFGFFPAVSEEFTSRMFSIPFFERILRSTAGAIVVAAFIWGFGHAAYPNQPFWIRGLEVGLAGIVFGIVLLRFGIVSVLICHFSVDALYTAFVLIRSPNIYYRISGTLSAGIFVVLFLVAAVAYVRRGGFLPGERTNEAEGVAPPPEPRQDDSRAAAIAYRPIPAATLLWGLVLAVVFLGAAFVPRERFGDWVRLRATREAALRASAEFLRDAGFDVSSYRSAIVLGDRIDPTDAAYLKETGGTRLASKFYESLVPTPVWRVRYFVPGQKEEYRVSVDTNTGSVNQFARTIAEDAPGASVPKERALELASAFLAGHGVDPAAGELREQTQRDEKARRDHTLVWELPEQGAAEAKVRYEVLVQGDTVASWTRSVKIPEDWRRKREEDTALTVVLRWLWLPFLASIAVFAILLLVEKIRAGEIPWKLTLLLGGIAAVFTLTTTALGSDMFWMQYPTSTPAGTQVIFLVIVFIFAALTGFVFAVPPVALAGALFPAARTMLRRTDRAAYARDALVAGVVALGFLLGMPALTRLVEIAIPSGALIDGVTWPTGAESKLPFLSALTGAAFWVILLPCLGGIVVAVLSRYLRGTLVRVLLAIGFVLSFLPSGARTMPEYLVGALSLVLVGVAVLLVVRLFLRDNPLAWAFAPAFALCARAGIRFLMEPSGNFRASGVLLLLVAAVPAVWLLLSARARGPEGVDPVHDVAS